MFFHTEQISQNWKLMGTKVCCHAVQKISIWCCYVWRNLQKRAGFIVLQFKVNLCDHTCHWAMVPALHPRRVRIWERDSRGSPTPLCKSFPPLRPLTSGRFPAAARSWHHWSWHSIAVGTGLGQKPAVGFPLLDWELLLVTWEAPPGCRATQQNRRERFFPTDL